MAIHSFSISCFISLWPVSIAQCGVHSGVRKMGGGGGERGGYSGHPCDLYMDVGFQLEVN